MKNIALNFFGLPTPKIGYQPAPSPPQVINSALRTRSGRVNPSAVLRQPERTRRSAHLTLDRRGERQRERARTVSLLHVETTAGCLDLRFASFCKYRNPAPNFTAIAVDVLSGKRDRIFQIYQFSNSNNEVKIECLVVYCSLKKR